MKKIKISALILCIATLITCFTSCIPLDDLRDAQAFWTGDDSIEFNDAEYKLFYTDYQFIERDSKILNITEKDVPVLLSEARILPFNTRTALLFKNANVISTYGNYYVKNDVYEEYKNKSDNLILNSYGGNIYDMNTHNYVFTQYPENICKIFNEALAGIPEELDNVFGGYQYTSTATQEILLVDKDAIFTDNSYIYIVPDANGKLYLAREIQENVPNAISYVDSAGEMIIMKNIAVEEPYGYTYKTVYYLIAPEYYAEMNTFFAKFANNY